MLASLSILTLRGTLVFGIVWLADRLLTNHMSARARRSWWWIVAAGFLVPLGLIALPEWAPKLSAFTATAHSLADEMFSTATGNPPPAPMPFGPSWSALLGWLWLGGASVRLVITLVQTARTQRRWARQRLCTDSTLFSILEDCRERSGISAPIGLVLVPRLGSPALLGWLRPRILLPANFAATASPTRLRAVFLHELAHHRSGDLVLHWLFQFVLAIHWFNPCAYLAVRQWLRFRELAADEQALAWLPDDELHTYGESLVDALREHNEFSTPSGALALGEPLQNLKQRIQMITHYTQLRHHRLVSLGLSALLAATVLLPTLRAATSEESKAQATQSSLEWLALLDGGDYAASWNSAGSIFKSKVTKAQWALSVGQARTPLGDLRSRTVASVLLQPAPAGVPGDNPQMVLIQYRSTFANLAAAMETVTFLQESDGHWRAAGYFVRAE